MKRVKTPPIKLTRKKKKGKREITGKSNLKIINVYK